MEDTLVWRALEAMEHKENTANTQSWKQVFVVFNYL